MAKKRLGELLLEQGTITREQLEAALAYQRQSGNRLGAALVDQGVLTEEKLCAALATALGLQVIALDETEVDWSALHSLRDRFCEANDLFPVNLEVVKSRKVLTVAMADPLNLPAIEEIEFTTGCKVQPRLATLSQVRAAIRVHYHRVGDVPQSAELPSGPYARPIGVRAPPKAAPPTPPVPMPELAKASNDAIVDAEPEQIILDATPLPEGPIVQVPSVPVPVVVPSADSASASASASPSATTPAEPSPAAESTATAESALASATPAAKESEPEPKIKPKRDVTDRTALADLIREREAAKSTKNKARRPPAKGPNLESDLEYLVGEQMHPHDPSEQLERLERKLWALMRIMAKKGVLTREEFLAEFDE